MKKRFLALLLALVLTCATTVPALSSEAEDAVNEVITEAENETPSPEEAREALTRLGEKLAKVLAKFLPKGLQGPFPNPLQAWIDLIPEPETFDIDLTFAGDCMLASYKGQVKAGSFSSKALEHDWEYFLDGVDEYFEADDFTIVNLENVLTDKKLSEVAKDHNPAYWYKGPTENTSILTSQSVEIVNLSNNHTGDYGSTGTADTIQAVEDAGLLWGNGQKTLYVEKNGFRIAFIFNGLWSEWQANGICDRIREAEEQSDFQVVYFHGGTERIHAPEQWKQRACRKIVDAGADLVIGNHPHVLQPLEIYEGVPIIYSMGNFCYGGHTNPENRTILYQYKLTVDQETNTLKAAVGNIVPCYVYTGRLNNYQPVPITDEKEKQRVLDFMDWKLSSPL